MVWKHSLCVVALFAVVHWTGVAAQTTQEQNVLRALASSFPSLSAGSWSPVDASNACTTWNYLTCDGGNTNVLQLDFTELALNNAFPADISGLAFLTSLRAAKAGITGALPILPSSLQHLNLSYNALTGSLSNLASLSALINLDLHNNSFSGALINFSTLTALSALNLDGNTFALCTANPNFPGSLTTCSIQHQVETSCACQNYYMSCMTDVCAPDAGIPQSVPYAVPTSMTPLVYVPSDVPSAVPSSVPYAEPAAEPMTEPYSTPISTPVSAPEPMLEPSAAPNMIPESIAPNATVPEVLVLPEEGELQPIGVCADATAASGVSPYPVSYIFSYHNNLSVPVTIPVGEYNALTPPDSMTRMPTYFYPGTHHYVMRVDSTLASTAKWSLNRYAATLKVDTATGVGLCPPLPSLTSFLQFSGSVSDMSVAAADIKAHLLSMWPSGVNGANRLLVSLTDTSTKRAASLSANVTVLNDLVVVQGIPISFTISAFGLMQRLMTNLSQPLGRSQLTSSISNGNGLVFASSSSLVTFPTTSAVYDPPGSPQHEPRRPWSYFMLTGPQTAGVVISVLGGVAILIAVIVGLWYVSRPNNKGNSALSATNTNTNGRNSSARDTSFGGTNRGEDSDNDSEADEKSAGTDNETDDEEGDTSPSQDEDDDDEEEEEEEVSEEELEEESDAEDTSEED